MLSLSLGLEMAGQRMAPQTCHGVIDQLSHWQNELGLLVDGELWLFYVPASCGVSVDGRLGSLDALQSGQRVRVTYEWLPNVLVARGIEAHRAGVEVIPWE